jgi:hypothetical protein
MAIPVKAVLQVDVSGKLSGIRRLVSMQSSWHTKTGQLECRWSKIGQRIQYKPRWMQETPLVEGSHLPPLPDFVHHSPFGGTFWFQRYTYLNRDIR